MTWIRRCSPSAVGLAVAGLVMAGIPALAQAQKVKPGFVPQPAPTPGLHAPAGADQLVTLTYEGLLLDCWDQPLVGAKVTFTNVANGRTYTTTTDQRGVFRFQGVQPGTYRLYASHPSFGASCAFAGEVIVSNRIKPLKIPPG